MNMKQVFSDEFISENKDYLDFLIRDNLQYLKMSGIIWGSIIFLTFFVEVMAS